MQHTAAVASPSKLPVKLHRQTWSGWLRRLCRPQAAAMAAAATSPSPLPHARDLTDITRSNFWEALPAVQSALSECTFFSFDLEMTGLFLDGQGRDEYLDEPQDRYNRVREAAQAYTITQLGLSCWKRLPAPSNSPAATAEEWEATTFNAWVWPEPMQGEMLGGVAPPPRRFLVDASSLTFLSDNGFDLNTWVREGMSYMGLREHTERTVQFEKGVQAAARDSNGESMRNSVTVEKPDDVAFVQRLVDQVVDWLALGTGELVLQRMNGYQRLLAYQELGRPRKWQAGGEPGGTPNDDPGFYTTKVEINNWKHIKLVRGNKAEAEAAEAARVAAQRVALQRASGLSEVLRAMRDSGKPCVCHNGFFDLAYLLGAMGHGLPLPSSWTDFRQLVSQWFPGGVYDTKLLSRELPAAVLPLGTGLGDVYSALTAEEGPRAAALGLLAAAAAAAAPTSSTSHSPELPNVRHAAPTRKYAAVTSLHERGPAHEAGYDAWMTGAAFAHLLQLVPAAMCLPPQTASKQQQEQSSAPAVAASPMQVATSALPAAAEPIVQPTAAATYAGQWQVLQSSFNGCISISRSDLPFLSLLGEEPPIRRLNVLHMWGGPSGTRIPELLSLLEGVGLPGRPRLTRLPPGHPLGGYLVELPPQAVGTCTSETLAAGLARAAAAAAADADTARKSSTADNGTAGTQEPSPPASPLHVTSVLPGWQVQSWEAFVAARDARAVAAAAAAGDAGEPPVSSKRQRLDTQLRTATGTAPAAAT